MYILVYLRYNENKRTSNSRKAVMPMGQRRKGNLEKVNSLLTSNILISDAHIIKNGTPAIAQKFWLPFIRKQNSYIKLPGPEVQGFTLPGTAGPRPSRLHTRCLGGTTQLTTSFQQFSILFGRGGCVGDSETYQGIYQLLQCRVPLRALLLVLFRTNLLKFLFLFLEKGSLKA